MIAIKSRAERLNEIQVKWTSFTHKTPKAERQSIFAQMKEIPNAYFSVSEDMQHAQPMQAGSPLCDVMPFGDCLKAWSGKVQSSVLWQNGRWIDYVI